MASQATGQVNWPKRLVVNEKEKYVKEIHKTIINRNQSINKLSNFFDLYIPIYMFVFSIILEKFNI